MGRQKATGSQPQQQQQQQLKPSRLLYSGADREGVGGERQHYVPKTGSITRQTAGHAAVARACAAKPAQQHTAAGKAVGAAAELELCYQAVCAPVAAAADCTPASCLSPLHWHQPNLGRGRDDFYQAMVSSEVTCHLRCFVLCELCTVCPSQLQLLHNDSSGTGGKGASC
jgi:hypothetical protein